MVGTIFESSHIPLHKWLWAFYLLSSSTEGMSSHRLHRMPCHLQDRLVHGARVREAMKEEPFQRRLSGVMEADETYVGGQGTKPQAALQAQNRPRHRGDSGDVAG